MSRYQAVFSEAAKRGEGCFIPFAMAGDPDFKTSEAIFKAYIDGGADILEIGYPFSDPIADGPVNQRAAQRAIAAGMNPFLFFKLIEKIRKYSEKIPIGILLYANTIHHYGYKEFCREASLVGIDSLLIADMPPEEYGEVEIEMKNNKIDRVFIVSELTPIERMRLISSKTDAFIYVVSRLGTTGTGKKVNEGAFKVIKELKKVTTKPVAVGFGISKPEHVKEIICSGADAAIVGSALVEIIEKNLNKKEQLPELLRKKIHQFKNGTRIRKN